MQPIGLIENLLNIIIRYFTDGCGVLWIVVLEVCGFLGMIVGFIITWKESKAAKISAQNAESSANKARDEIYKNNAAYDLINSINGLEEIRRKIRNDSCDGILDLLSDLIKKIINIKKLYPEFTDGQKTILQEALVSAKNIQNKLDTDLMEHKTYRLNSSQMRSISRHIDNLIELSADLRRNLEIRNVH